MRHTISHTWRVIIVVCWSNRVRLSVDMRVQHHAPSVMRVDHCSHRDRLEGREGEKRREIGGADTKGDTTTMRQSERVRHEHIGCGVCSIGVYHVRFSLPNTPPAMTRFVGEHQEKKLSSWYGFAPCRLPPYTCGRSKMPLAGIVCCCMFMCVS